MEARRLVFRLMTIGAVLFLAACGEENDAERATEPTPPGAEATATDEPRYSANQLERGVDTKVADDASAIVSATVLLPDDLPSYLSLSPALFEQGIAVMQPGEGGFDVVVLYRTGPYCGLLPKIAVTGDEFALDVAITSRRLDDCDALEYDEAVGFMLQPGFESATITASHERANR